MGTALECRVDRIESNLSRKNFLRLREARLLIMKDRLVETKCLAKERLPEDKQITLNERLWSAFVVKNDTEMFRLISAGADPYSIQNKLNREKSSCLY